MSRRSRKIVDFTGGRRCKECAEQIAPARLRASPRAIRCIDCEAERDRWKLVQLQGVRDKDIVIIKG